MAKYYFNEEENAKWLANLPKKSVAAKVVIKSNKGNILLVKPNYKKSWQLPGGGIEAGEEPKFGLIRELQEELCLNVIATDLKLLDTVFRQEHDNLILIYEYKVLLNEDQVIQYQKDELDGYRYEASQNVSPLLSDYYTDFWQTYTTRRNS